MFPERISPSFTVVWGKATFRRSGSSGRGLQTKEGTLYLHTSVCRPYQMKTLNQSFDYRFMAYTIVKETDTLWS